MLCLFSATCMKSHTSRQVVVGVRKIEKCGNKTKTPGMRHNESTCVFLLGTCWPLFKSQIIPALTRRLKFHLGRPEDLMKTLINITLLHSPLTDINLADRYTNRQQAGEQKPAEPKQSKDTPSHPCFTT